MMQVDAVKRGELFPGKSDKDGKWKGVKAGQGFESNKDTDHKFCLVCSRLKYMQEGTAKTHNTQDCRQLAKFNMQVEERVEGENTSRIRRENYAGQRASSQGSYADQSQSSSVPHPYYDVQLPYTSQYPIQQLMVQQVWSPQQHMQPASHAMGQYRPGSNGQMVLSANMSSITSPRPQPNVCDETSEYEEMQRELRPAYTAEHRTMYSPSAEHRTMYSPSTSTPSTVRSVSREQVDRESASANMAIQPSIMGSLTDEQKQARDRHWMNRTLFGNYLIDAQEEQQFRREMSAIASSVRTAYKEPSFDGYQAMPAIIAQDDVIYDNQSTPLTQRGGWRKDFRIYANRANRNG
jgi:hypothetical protein